MYFWHRVLNNNDVCLQISQHSLFFSNGNNRLKEKKHASKHASAYYFVNFISSGKKLSIQPDIMKKIAYMPLTVIKMVMSEKHVMHYISMHTWNNVTHFSVNLKLELLFCLSFFPFYKIIIKICLIQ